VSDGINKAKSWTTSRSRRRDSGTTFVELLISIVLLGIGVLAVLTASRAAIIGSTTERDHSKAHEWLQSASEVVADPAGLAWLDCDLPLDGEQIRASYEASLRGESSIVPETWDSSRIAIPDAVTFAQPSGDYGSACFDAIDRQLITIEVSDPEGEIIERVQIVKAAP
jgi:hypothetical protein